MDFSPLLHLSTGSCPAAVSLLNTPAVQSPPGEDAMAEESQVNSCKNDASYYFLLLKTCLDTPFLPLRRRRGQPRLSVH